MPRHSDWHDSCPPRIHLVPAAAIERLLLTIQKYSRDMEEVEQKLQDPEKKEAAMKAHKEETEAKIAELEEKITCEESAYTQAAIGSTESVFLQDALDELKAQLAEAKQGR